VSYKINLILILSATACSSSGKIYENICENPELTPSQQREYSCNLDMHVTEWDMTKKQETEDLSNDTGIITSVKKLDLLTTQTDNAVLIEWESIPNAEYYEIKINNGPWIKTEDPLSYLDDSIEHNTGTASIKPSNTLTRGEATIIISDIVIPASEEKRYEVRAVAQEPIAQGVVWAKHKPELKEAIIMYSDDESEWSELYRTNMENIVVKDSNAPLNGDKRHYKAVIYPSNEKTFETSSIVSQRLAATHVYAIGERTCVLFNNSRVKCFGGGANTPGLLGYEDTVHLGDSLDELPTPYVDIGLNVVSLSLSSSGTCALSTDQTVSCWGWQKVTGNINTSIFIGDEDGEMPPEPFTFIKPVSHLMSSSNGLNFCAIATSDEVNCWSPNHNIILGYEDMVIRELPPFEYLNLGRPIKSVISVESGMCALGEDDTIMCWGNWLLDRNIGDKTGDMPPPLLNVSGRSTKVISFSGGKNHACIALERHTQVYCWGNNMYQQLGHNLDDFVGNNMSEFPVPAVSLADVSFVKQVSAGGSSSCGLLDNGNVTCWGYNRDGRLGYIPQSNETIHPRANIPIELGGKAVQIATGTAHNCALMSDGEVKCWGRNDFGQLGVGHTDIIGDDEGEMPPANAIIYD